MRHLRKWLLLITAMLILSFPFSAFGQDTPTNTPAPDATEEGAPAGETEPTATATEAEEGPVPTSVPDTGPTSVPADIAAEFRVSGAPAGYDVMQAIRQTYSENYPNVEVTVGVAGTSGGFRRFCDGEAIFNSAERPIFESEAERCATNGIEWIELLVGYEGVVLAAHPEVTAFAACLTTDQLATMWSRAAQPIEAIEPTTTPEGYVIPEDAATPLPLPAASAGVTNWNQVDASFPDLALLLYGDLNTRAAADMLSAVVTGDQGDIRTDYTSAPVYQTLVDEMVGKPGAIGFFNFGYYGLNEQELVLVAVDASAGCITPSAETLADGTYPLARPVYLYVNAAQLDDPAVRAFIDLYLSEEGLAEVSKAGLFSTSDEVYAQDRAAIADRVTGRAFTEAPPEPEPVVTPTPTAEPTEESAAPEATREGSAGTEAETPEGTIEATSEPAVEPTATPE